MTFRAKVFLSVLVPAGLLVSAVVVAAVIVLSREAEVSARADLARTRTAFETVLGDQFEALRKLGHPFESSRINAAISTAVNDGDLKILKERIDLEFGYIGMELVPDLYEVRDYDGKILVRSSKTHTCADGCDHPMQPWMEEKTRALTAIGGEPYVAFLFELENGLFLFGTRFVPFLERLSRDFSVDVVLADGGSVVFSSLSEWKPGGAPQSERRVEGVRFLQRPVEVKELELDHLFLLRSMEAVDRQVRRTIFLGLGALALSVLAAALVSTRVARGISRPVETLVVAAGKVGGGDYTAKVDIPGRDEMAHLGAAFNDMTDGLRKRREIMELTLSRDVASEMMKGTELGGMRRKATILFMDIRGFTQATEGVDPADVVTLLNDMLKPLAEAVDRQGGNINKYLGDGLLAMFGAPRKLDRHAALAMRAALDMQAEVAKWNAARAEKGLDRLHIGVGLNTGTVVGGYVGSERRLEYTVIGEEVNLASRVCGKAAPGQILVTKQTLDEAGEGFKVNALPPVNVKGLSYPIPIFEVLG